MFVSHEYVLKKLAQQREAELFEEARISRLLAEIRADKPGFRARFFSRSGDILIHFGHKLKDRYTLETYLAPQQPCLEGMPCD
jgi:hypothetical protein